MNTMISLRTRRATGNLARHPRAALFAAIATATALSTWAPPAAAQACLGDCNGDGFVTVDEILTGVNIALGAQELASCLSFDGNGDSIVSVDEIIQALNVALTGCAVEPGTPTPTPTPTATPTPPDRVPVAVDRPEAGVLELAAAVPVVIRFDTQTLPQTVRALVGARSVVLDVDPETGTATGTATNLGGGAHTLTVEVDYGNELQSATVDFDAVALDHPDECEILNAASCLFPYPSSRFLEPADTATGVRLSFPAIGMPAQRGVRIPVGPYLAFDGYSPTVGITMHFPQGVDPERTGASRLLEETRTHDLRSLDGDSPTLLIDAETGERVLHFVEVDARAAMNDALDREVLIMNPARSLTPGRRYIVAMRNLVDRTGAPVVAEPTFAALRDGTPTRIAALETRRPQMDALFAELAEFDVERETVTLAFDFVVASDASLTDDMVLMRDETFAWLETVAGEVTFTVDRVVERDCAVPGTRLWRTIEGSFQVPLYLQDDPLARPELPSRLRRGDDALPAAEGFTNPPYTIALPCIVLDPERPVVHPVVLGHGLFGDGRGLVSDLTGTSEIEAFNYIAGATDWSGLAGPDAGNGDNIVGSFVGRVALDQPRNFPALPDRLRQGQLNTLVLARLMKTGAFNLHPAFQFEDGSGVFPGGEVEQFYFGASLGGIMGLMFAALSPDVTQVAVNVPGINFSLLLPRSTAFIIFEAAIRLTGVTDPIDQRVMLLLAHELWVRGEAAGYATHVTANPLPGTNVKEVLMTAALHDHLVSNQATELAARTLGLSSLVGSILPGLPGIPDADGPLASGLVFYDAKAFDPNDPRHVPFIPPLQNIPPELNGCDPHGRQAFIPAAIEQLFGFLRPSGEIVNHCNGPCDGGEPYELPFGGQRPCNPV